MRERGPEGRPESGRGVCGHSDRAVLNQPTWRARCTTVAGMCKSKVPHCTTLPWKMGPGLGGKGAVADVVGAPHPFSPLLCPAAAAVVDSPDTSSSLPEALVSSCRAA